MISTGMEWAEGDEWTVELLVPPGIYDFKCVVTRSDGSIAEWEPGENRSFRVTPFLQDALPFFNFQLFKLSSAMCDIVFDMELVRRNESNWPITAAWKARGWHSAQITLWQSELIIQ